MVSSSGNTSWLTMAWSHLCLGGNTIGYSNERQQVASTNCLQVMRHGVFRHFVFGIPSDGDTFLLNFICCILLGFPAPPAIGSHMFVIQAMALRELWVMFFAVFGPTPCVTSGIPKVDILSIWDPDKEFNESRRVNCYFCKEMDIGPFETLSLGREHGNICCIIWCEPTVVYDSFCPGICVCLSIVMKYGAMRWVTPCFLSGHCLRVGKPVMGSDECTFTAMIFPLEFAVTQCLHWMMEQPHGRLNFATR